MFTIGCKKFLNVNIVHISLNLVCLKLTTESHFNCYLTSLKSVLIAVLFKHSIRITVSQKNLVAISFRN